MSNLKDFITTYVGSYAATGPSLAEADWEFIAGAAVLIVLIVCFFKSVRFVFRRFNA